MNSSERYAGYALCREMLETAEVIRRFDPAPAEALPIASDKVIFSGEGSSRIFPSKRLIAQALRRGWNEQFATEGARQAAEYRLDRWHLCVASNSGKTAEGVFLLRTATPAGSTGIVAFPDTPIATSADSSYVLSCGPENAVAATKSVVEQALVYDALFRKRNGTDAIDTAALADAAKTVLTQELPEEIVSFGNDAAVLYFAGRNDGVAEELTLKTNEITRKRSDYLEGTYAVHGIEEVMSPNDLVILVDPYREEEEKYRRVLQEGVGLSVIAIASRQTTFPTVRVPDMGELNPYLQLLAGWNLLVEIGLASGIDLDKPERARKVGNEYVE
jgi:glucosamine--fructose-6-phosphate aminotransferase (isomerizing)